MNWVRILGTAGLAFALAAPLAAATIVSSRGPSAGKYPIGRKITGGDVALAAGDVVTLLDDKGTRVLRGPGSFPVTQAGGETKQSVFSALVQDRKTVRVRTGSVRNGPNGEPPRSPNLWYVDVTRPGTYCVTDPADLRLWRPTMAEEQVMTVRAGKASVVVRFGKGDMVAPWDGAAVPVKAGTSYELLGSDGKPAGTLLFRTLTEPPKDMEALATTLIGEGCTEQLDLLATTVQLPEG